MVGTVILFGFLILAMATYQVQFVPTENAEIEFEHSQQVGGEFLDLRNTVLNTGQSDTNRLTSLTLGTRYPQRTFFLNPPPATGEVSTSERQTIRIESATVAEDGNVGLFWDDRNLTFPTKSVRYSPSYNEYQNPPDLIYEHSLVVAEFDDAALTRTGQTTVTNDADRISLTLVDGNLSESGIDRREIDPEVLSQNARSVTLEPDGGNVGITLPTTVPGGEKRENLAAGWNETFESGVDRTVTATSDGIRIEIETDNSVQLRLAQVGLGRGTDVTNESNGYITKVSNSGGIVTAEVRDEYNNPVANADVRVSTDSKVQTNSTDESGQLQLSVSSDTDFVEMEINDGESSWESVRFDTSGTSEQRGDDTYDVEWSISKITSSPGVSYDSSIDEILVNRSETGATLPVYGSLTSSNDTVSGGTIDLATSDPAIASFLDSQVVSNQTGDFDSELNVSGNTGIARTFAAVATDVDEVTFNISGDIGETPSGSQVEYNDDASHFWGSETVQFSVSNIGSSPVAIEEIQVESDAADILLERDGGQNQPGQHEIFVQGNTNGYYEAGDSQQARYTLGNRVPLSNSATISSGQEAEFYLRDFRTEGNGQQTTTVNMAGQEVSVTIYYEDGSQQTVSFTVTGY